MTSRDLAKELWEKVIRVKVPGVEDMSTADRERTLLDLRHILEGRLSEVYRCGLRYGVANCDCPCRV